MLFYSVDKRHISIHVDKEVSNGCNGQCKEAAKVIVKIGDTVFDLFNVLFLFNAPS